MKKPFVVGIAGATQSGKTTFANKLKKLLSNIEIKTFHIDNYHKPKDKQPVAEAPFTRKNYIDFNSPISFDLPQLYLDLSNEIDDNIVELIIVEGTLVLYDEPISNSLDLKIFVDSKADDRAKRYIEQYSKHHGHEFIKDSYFDLVQHRMEAFVEPTKWSADIILNGSKKSEKAVEIIRAYLYTLFTS